jgi:catechol 2,3-dioxygenase-like lactoylglutathione lyase family enzyme
VRVKRIVANVAAPDLDAVRAFYGEVLGLDLLMDLGFFVTYGSSHEMKVQMGAGTEGGSGTPVPDISIEVDDLDEALERFEAGGVRIEYGPVDEPWGVRRFYVRDPSDKLINVLQHL